MAGPEGGPGQARPRAARTAPPRPRPSSTRAAGAAARAARRLPSPPARRRTAQRTRRARRAHGPRSRLHLLKCLPEPRPRGGERRADRAGADRECVGDCDVVEVGVVVQEDDLALSFREQVERQERRMPVRGRLGSGDGLGPAPAARVAGGVDDDRARPTPRASRAPVVRRLRIAVANASCTASRPASRSPAIAAATRRNCGRRRRYSASSSSTIYLYTTPGPPGFL